jgi:hypothetical protein
MFGEMTQVWPRTCDVPGIEASPALHVAFSPNLFFLLRLRFADFLCE